MKRRIFIFGGSFVIFLLIGILAWALLDTRGAEPLYRGKPLSYWLSGFNPSASTGKSAPQWIDAVRAVEGMGTNSLPILMRMLKRKDSKLKTAIINLATKQHFVTFHVETDEHDNLAALHALSALGSAGSNAVPQLVALFRSDPSPFPQQAVPWILGSIGSPAKPAIPMLLSGLAHTNFMVRNNCVYALGHMHEDPEVVVPALTKCLQDPDSLVVAQAAQALGNFGRDARSALPALRQLCGTNPAPATGGINVPLNTSAGFHWQSAATMAGGRTPNVPGAAHDAIEKINAATGPEPDAK